MIRNKIDKFEYVSNFLFQSPKFTNYNVTHMIFFNKLWIFGHKIKYIVLCVVTSKTKLEISLSYMTELIIVTLPIIKQDQTQDQHFFFSLKQPNTPFIFASVYYSICLEDMDMRCLILKQFINKYINKIHFLYVFLKYSFSKISRFFLSSKISLHLKWYICIICIIWPTPPKSQILLF